MKIGVYGDVIRVKIMFNKKDNALVQYVDPNQARVGAYIIFFTNYVGAYIIVFSNYVGVYIICFY